MDQCDAGEIMVPQLYILMGAQLVACAFLVFHIFTPLRLADIKDFEFRANEVLTVSE